MIIYFLKQRKQEPTWYKKVDNSPHKLSVHIPESYLSSGKLEIKDVNEQILEKFAMMENKSAITQ